MGCRAVASDKVVVEGEAASFGARGDGELAEDRAEMHVDGVRTDDQAFGDFFVGQPLRDEAQHLDLALAQPRRVGGGRESGVWGGGGGAGKAGAGTAARTWPGC